LDLLFDPDYRTSGTTERVLLGFFNIDCGEFSLSFIDDICLIGEV
jgi:hypothetical protein